MRLHWESMAGRPCFLVKLVNNRFWQEKLCPTSPKLFHVRCISGPMPLAPRSEADPVWPLWRWGGHQPKPRLDLGERPQRFRRRAGGRFVRVELLAVPGGHRHFEPLGGIRPQGLGSQALNTCRMATTNFQSGGGGLFATAWIGCLISGVNVGWLHKLGTDVTKPALLQMMSFADLFNAWHLCACVCLRVCKWRRHTRPPCLTTSNLPMSLQKQLLEPCELPSILQDTEQTGMSQVKHQAQCKLTKRLD